MELSAKMVENGDEKGYYSNPFKVDEDKIAEIFKEVKSAPFEMADVRTGEVSFFQHITKSKRVVVDKGNYVKLFKSNVPVVMGLSDKSLRLFVYIAVNVGIHAESVYLDCETICEYCNWKKSTFYACIVELVSKRVIARKKGSSIEFFVNINYVFNGSRLKVKG